MTSEWMKVMLEEIARKKAEAEQDQLEEQRRQQAGQHVHPEVVLQSDECAKR
jgi:hypothetical protein